MRSVAAKVCLVAASLCAAGIAVVPVAVRWLLPLEPIREPQNFVELTGLVFDAMFMAGRGAWTMAWMVGLALAAIVFAIAAYVAVRWVQGTRAERRKCAMPLLIGVVAIIAAIVLDEWLPEIRR
jgi:hypothetical protein